MAVLVRHEPEVFATVLPTVLTVPVTRTGSVAEGLVAPAGGLTAVTLTRSTVTSTTPAPRMPLTPVACTVSPRMTTGARVVIATAVVGAPGGSTTTGPLSPSTDWSVRPLPMTIASAYVPGSTSTVPPSPTMSIPS